MVSLTLARGTDESHAPLSDLFCRLLCVKFESRLSRTIEPLSLLVIESVRGRFV